MPIFVVTYSHPDLDGWNTHVGAHVDWLVEQVAAGRIVASGPFVSTAVKAAMLLIDVPDRPALEALIATDPFAIEGLIEDMTVMEWDPMFGSLGAER